MLPERNGKGWSQQDEVSSGFIQPSLMLLALGLLAFLTLPERQVKEGGAASLWWCTEGRLS
jgi:hypothetical protein